MGFTHTHTHTHTRTFNYLAGVAVVLVPPSHQASSGFAHLLEGLVGIFAKKGPCRRQIKDNLRFGPVFLGGVKDVDQKEVRSNGIDRAKNTNCKNRSKIVFIYNVQLNVTQRK